MQNLKSLKIEMVGDFVVTHFVTTFSLSACKIRGEGS